MKLEQLKANFKTFAFFTCMFLFILWIYSKQRNLTNNLILTKTIKRETNHLADADSKFLVRSSKCRIPNLNPFNADVKRFYRRYKYARCTDRDLLTYIKKQNNITVLHINTKIAASYKAPDVFCCYSNITRSGNKKRPDNGFRASNCQHFIDNVTLAHGMILVKCYKSELKKSLVYTNTHAAITINEESRAKPHKFAPNTLSILIVGIDSISRLNFIRTLPETYNFLKKNKWIELTGYNKVGDNTFPNLMAIFTGLNESLAYKICNPMRLGYLDKCNFVWHDFSSFDYITAYAEDEGSISSFNFNKKGFVNQPTDYYFRPYVLASEKLKIVRREGMMYCTGPETSGERILNIAKDFAITFKNHANFGLFWMNSFSHNQINSPSRMDGKVRDFLRDITDAGAIENSMVVFLSDHGLRFGEIRYTRSGWLEERLPYIFISVPKWFRKSFPQAFTNLQDNTAKLVTPYDLYMTLQDVLVLSGKQNETKQSVSCPKCKSLFREIESNRSCEDASITQHWCTCTGYTPINTKNATVVRAATFILEKLEDIRATRGNQSKRCVKMKLKRVISSSISNSITEWYKNNTYLLIVLETSPYAVFEGTVDVMVSNNGSMKYSLSGGISRLNYYHWHSKCVRDPYLKRLCYCR